MKTIGIISDTHGLLRPQALEALNASDLILHAGDIGDPEILAALEEIAGVVSVRGNMDFGSWADGLHLTEVVEVDGFAFYITHDLDTLDVNPKEANFNAVVFGHSHRPLLEQRNGVWFINPGSAGPRRFNYPVTVCIARLDGDQFSPEIIDLME